jgi:hypothetical protein
MLNTIKLETKPDESKNTVWYNVLPIRKFSDKRYGTVDINFDLIKKMEENFKKGIPTYEPPLNLRHNDDSGKYGRALKLEARKEGLFVLWEFFDNGVKKINEDHFEYMSAEYTDSYSDKNTGEDVGPVFLGAALTNRPAHPGVSKILFEDVKEDLKQFFQNLFSLKKEEEEDETMDKKLEERINALEDSYKKLEEENKSLKKELEEAKKGEKESNKKKFESEVEAWAKDHINKGALPSQVEGLKKIVLETENPEMMKKFDEVLNPGKKSNLTNQLSNDDSDPYPNDQKDLEERINRVKKFQGGDE